MEWLLENWYVLGILAVLVAAGLGIYKFAGLPTAEQILKIKKMLLYWVTLAEKELGSGTGELKLRYVYDLFLVKFPFTAKLISFEAFSLWVDEALDEMKKLLEKNKAVDEFINNEKGIELSYTPIKSIGFSWTVDSQNIITSTTAK
jgi:hypothetical protein